MHAIEWPAWMAILYRAMWMLLQHAQQLLKKMAAGNTVLLFRKNFSALVIEKGSITLNGISLTLFNVGINSFSVAVIPYTYEHTNIKGLKEGDGVNVEFDMLGKYVQRMLQQKAVI